MTNKRDLDILFANEVTEARYPFCEVQYLKMLKERKILYNEDCSSNIIEMVLLPLQQLANDGSNAPIEIVLNTDGGEYFEVLVLCNFIETIKCPLTITILGKACSAGIYLAMAGKNNPQVTRRCYPFSIGLLHGGYQQIAGTLTQHIDQVDFTKEYEKQIKAYVLCNSNIASELYDTMYRNDWYFNASALLEKGIVDYIITE